MAELMPSASILLLEAGAEGQNSPAVTVPSKAQGSVGSALALTTNFNVLLV
jgi:hypothetical protein